ncbi:MAG: ATP-binding protein [Pseudomonadota bacterium]
MPGRIGEQEEGKGAVSNLNIKRAVENIRANTTAYTPVVETIVNAIQAIEGAGRGNGKITVRVLRSAQLETDDSLGSIVGFEIEDNGVGFTDEHRQSFDTLYSDLKIMEGGKGFGRFTCLKHFEDLHVVSVFNGTTGYQKRTFSMGKDNEIIVNEKLAGIAANDSGTVVHLDSLRRGSYEKKLSTLARTLVEKLLPYFITNNYMPPEIVLCERDGTGWIRLNDFTSQLSEVIQEINAPDNVFKLLSMAAEQEFIVRVFKFRSPKNHKSMISLVAHRREVSTTAIHNYVPEFDDDFYEKDAAGNADTEKNYILKAYVFGKYLDDNVALERGEFNFKQDSDLIFGISQSQIESHAAQIAKAAVGDEILTRQDKKKARIQSYVDEEAPWHKTVLNKIDLSTLPYNASNEDIETKLQRSKHSQEMQIKRDVKTIMDNSDPTDLAKNVLEIVGRISETSKNDLVHYIALRRNILDLFDRSLQHDKQGTYTNEGVVHDVIFPRKGDTDVTAFEDHNLWMIDERLNFTTYVSSDLPLDGSKSERPDLLVYNGRVSFRSDNEASNPITIFEFKKPFRDDFVNPSSKEDPVDQIVRYVNNIRDGKYKTPQGRGILVTTNTPFYAYVVCDLTQKVKDWLLREKNFTEMPDGLGWFHWYGNIRLYIEVWSWDRILRDAKMRNAVFFKKLGIN